MSAEEILLRYDRTLDCVHCGMCLPVCPTYRLTGKETASPRGRIYVMRAFAEGRLAETPETIEEIDRCLVCRACETVCPSGVQFGEMMELTRDAVERTPARGKLAARLKRWFFRGVLPHPARLRLLVEAFRAYQRLGLRGVAHRLGIVHLLGEKAVLQDALLPDIPPLTQRSDPPAVSARLGPGSRRVGFLVGCVAHELLPEANRAAITVLRRNGCEVHCPAARPCCGALPLHFGDREAARRLARHTVESFPEDLDAVVVSSAGCASAMKEFERLFAPQDPFFPRAQRFARSVRDFCEYLAALPLRPPRGRIAARVCYDEPCHLLHAQRLREPPRQLLSSIPGVELVPFEGQENCCGAAGLSSLICPEQSVALLEAKMREVNRAQPRILVTANPGCQLQLRSGAREWSPGVQVLHIAELLERAYAAE